MLEWLSSWLKDIILIILLAAFVDLILPNKALTRYVKLVVSLFILMAILSPLVQLLKADWSEKKLTSAIESLPEARPGGSAGEPDLEQILAGGTKLQAEQMQLTVPIVETRLAGMIRDELQAVNTEKVVEVKVTTVQGKDGELKLDTVEVEVSAVQAAAASESSGEGEWTMQPVQPVQVQIDVEQSRDSSLEGAVDNRWKEQAEAAKQRFLKQLGPKWGLTSEQLKVSYAEEAGSPDEK
ncbi:stage III sporulation protein AF [Paenibacillus gansuensis]|uniref:Stage III sporulation protein AF n=1 Tax=Paenibacillus gansuensis TaxID=306542 RepID=A0ABW5P9S9_9BACL